MKREIIILKNIKVLRAERPKLYPKAHTEAIFGKVSNFFKIVINSQYCIN